jgi:hypothetical protein
MTAGLVTGGITFGISGCATQSVPAARAQQSFGANVVPVSFSVNGKTHEPSPGGVRYP